MEANVKGYTLYHVSPQGKVYRKNEYYSRRGKKYIKNHKPWKEVRQSEKNGYLYASLSENGKRRILRVSRLVAETYLPNPLGKPQVCHKNNIRTDNRVENLYWGTAEENMQQMVRDGRLRGFCGRKGKDNTYYGKLAEENPNCLYPGRLRKRVYRYSLRHPEKTYVDLMKKFHMSRSVVSKIVTGRDRIIQRDYKDLWLKYGKLTKWKHLK